MSTQPRWVSVTECYFHGRVCRKSCVRRVDGRWGVCGRWPRPLPRGSRRPRPAVPVTCCSAAQSAPAARRLAIQTAARRVLAVPQRRSCRRRRVRAMEHRIVGPGPYRATRLVSEHEGASGPRSPGLPADGSVFASGAQAGPGFGGGTCVGRRGRCSKNGERVPEPRPSGAQLPSRDLGGPEILGHQWHLPL